MVIASWLVLSYIRMRQQTFYEKAVDARWQLEVEKSDPEQEGMLRLLNERGSTEKELREDPPRWVLGIAILAVGIGIGMVLPRDADPPIGIGENEVVAKPPGKEKKKQGAPRDAASGQRVLVNRHDSSSSETEDKLEVPGEQTEHSEPPVEGKDSSCPCPAAQPVREEQVPLPVQPPSEQPPFEAHEEAPPFEAHEEDEEEPPLEEVEEVEEVEIDPELE
jgi:hypothetical protein